MKDFEIFIEPQSGCEWLVNVNHIVDIRSDYREVKTTCGDHYLVPDGKYLCFYKGRLLVATKEEIRGLAIVGAEIELLPT